MLHLYAMIYLVIQYIPQYKSHACIIHVDSLHGNKENQKCTSLPHFNIWDGAKSYNLTFFSPLESFMRLKG